MESECGQEARVPHDRPPSAHQRRQVLARRSPNRQRLVRQVDQAVVWPHRQVLVHTARPRAGRLPARVLVRQSAAGERQRRLHRQDVGLGQATLTQRSARPRRRGLRHRLESRRSMGRLGRQRSCPQAVI